jgi:hypothetical protein
MQPEKPIQGCSSCVRSVPTDVKTSKWGWFSAIALAVLPKCPFCFLAFSSTMVVCTEAGMVTREGHAFSSPITIWLTATFSVLTLLAILFNYRSTKTPRALAVVLPGMGMVGFSVVQGGGEWLYYLGAVLMWVGVWLNGSLPAIWQKSKAQFRIWMPEGNQVLRR